MSIRQNVKREMLECMDLKELLCMYHEKRRELESLESLTSMSYMEVLYRYCDGFMSIEELRNRFGAMCDKKSIMSVMKTLDTEIRVRSDNTVGRSKEALEKQKQTVSIVDVARFYTNLPYSYRIGQNIKCFLPGHNDSTASLKLYEDNHFYCYGCKAHGTQIDMIAGCEGITIKQAIEKFLKM